MNRSHCHSEEQRDEGSAAGLNYWLTAVTRREYVHVGSATASLLSKVTAVSQQLKHSELGGFFGLSKEYLCGI
ncbi:MAG: hypothetical protein ACPGN5_06060 [Porticoccaceae bacterium]